MNKSIIIMLAIAFSIVSCSNDENKDKMKNENPFAIKGTPFETPSFSKISVSDYMPEFSAAMEEHKAEIAAIIDNQEPATFENTIAALDYSGSRLSAVSSIFYNVKSAETNKEMNDLAEQLSPIMSQHFDNISMNPEFFKRVKAVYENRESENLSVLQLRLLEKTYRSFVRSGALLEGDQKEQMRKINKELSALSLKFENNILSETNGFANFVENESELSGLPQSVKDAAALAAKEAGQEGKWLFTIHKPSLIPLLMYADNRDLREKMFMAYINKGNNNNEFDNKEILIKIANYRLEKANILGYKDWASYVLEENMAKNSENVYKLIDDLMNSALPKAKQEVKEMQSIIDAEGGNFKLAAWDWWYYSEKVKKAKYNFDEEELRPYFKLENVVNGAFEVANKLYGIKFEQRFDIDTYHKDVTVWEVKEEDGTHIGIIYLDFFPRAGKQGGAWMNEYRKQYVDKNGQFITPLVSNVCSFTPPTQDTPSLLSVDEVETLFHEFGHGLHGLLSKGVYKRFTGTDVAQDFVELPSQIMENWSMDPQVLKMYAKHYQTGEVIPDALIEKLEKSSKFNQGFTTVEYISAAILDMDWHTITEPYNMGALDFEAQSMKDMNMISEIVVRYRSTYFAHIFSGGYSSGYYVYVWAEILDADAFEAFKENGLFDRETASKFREHILSKGGSEDGMDLYQKFRGKQPSLEPLKRRKGLI